MSHLFLHFYAMIFGINLIDIYLEFGSGYTKTDEMYQEILNDCS